MTIAEHEELAYFLGQSPRATVTVSEVLRRLGNDVKECVLLFHSEDGKARFAIPFEVVTGSPDEERARFKAQRERSAGRQL